MLWDETWTTDVIQQIFTEPLRLVMPWIAVGSKTDETPKVRTS